MENVTVRNKNKKYTNTPAIKNLIQYIVREKDTDAYVEYWGTRGLVKDVNHAYKVIDRMQKYLKSNTGRRMYHIIISFTEKIRDPKVAYIVAEAIADYLGKEHQLVYGVHLDTDNYHIHYAVNAVNYATGKKWHKEKDEFSKWFRHIEKMAEEVLEEYYVI